MKKYYDYIIADMHGEFYEFTSDKELNLGEISKQIGIGSEEVVEINKYDVNVGRD